MITKLKRSDLLILSLAACLGIGLAAVIMATDGRHAPPAALKAESNAPTDPPAPVQWWIANSSLTKCHVFEGGPAALIDELALDHPSTRDYRDERWRIYKVEVSTYNALTDVRTSWTFYRDEGVCLHEQVNAAKDLADRYR